MSVVVTNPPPVGSKTPLYIEPSRYPLHTMCCFPRGDVLIGGAAESSVLTAGCQSFVKYAVENNSTTTIKAIEVTITEHVSCSAKGHKSSAFATPLYYRRLDLYDGALDLAPRPSQRADQRGGLQDYHILNQMLESDVYKLNVTVPSRARNTYNGSIIQVVHKLEIKAITTFGTVNSRVERLIQMYSQELPGDQRAQSVTPADVPRLPQDWKPQVAEPVFLPSMALSSAPLVAASDDDNMPVAYTVIAACTPAPAPASAPDTVYRSADQLIAGISQTYDPCGELEKYIRDGNSVDALTAEQYYVMFKTVNDVFDQQRFADILAGAATSITCTKVARALAGSKDMCKREVAEKLLCTGPILDKGENAHLVKSELTAFQFMTVEKYFTAPSVQPSPGVRATPVAAPDHGVAVELVAVTTSSLPAPFAPGVVVHANFDDFIAALRAAPDPCSELQAYMRTHSADDFSEEQFYAIFMTTKSAADQPRFATILAGSMSFVTCVNVARAVAACSETSKCEVAEKLLCAGAILDKHEHAHLLRSVMSDVQFAAVAKYLQ